MSKYNHIYENAVEIVRELHGKDNGLSFEEMEKMTGIPAKDFKKMFKKGSQPIVERKRLIIKKLGPLACEHL